MRLPRCGIAIAAVSVSLGVASASAQSASAQGTIWAECQSGSVAQVCQESSWYTSPVKVVWKTSTPPQETSPCRLEIEYEYATDGVTGLTCSAWWKTEGTDKRELLLHTEVSDLSTEVVPERPPDDNGWYNHPVAVTFKGRGYSGPAACFATGSSAAASYTGPDAVSATVSAKCVDPAGKSANSSFGLRYDSTPPTITNALPLRQVDFNGWFNHPVTFDFTGTDAMSGMEPCSATYPGPDSENAELMGVCHDRAGNAATLVVSFRYHATPPPLNASASAGDGLVSVRWRSNSGVEIVRSPGLHGPRASVLYSGNSGSFTDTRPRNGVRYIYTLKAKDLAGNVSQRTIAVTPGPRLLAPSPDAHVTAPPLLRWTPVRGANFYNVQLYRGHKLLSAWPVHTSFQLSPSWRFTGIEHRLARGRYSWYVWPASGTLSAARYGALIGHRSFVVE
jgi:hypothetical protein